MTAVTMLRTEHPVSVPPDRVCIHLRAVTCPECEGSGHGPVNQFGEWWDCPTCDGRGSVLPSLPDGPIHVAEPCTRMRYTIPVGSCRWEGCRCRGSGTLSQWVADRHELLPVVDDWSDERLARGDGNLLHPSDAGPRLGLRAGQWMLWTSESLAKTDQARDVTDEPWAASLKPGDAVAVLYDLRRIDPPITSTFCVCDCHDDYDMPELAADCEFCDGSGRVPLSVAPGVVNRIEVPK